MAKYQADRGLQNVRETVLKSDNKLLRSVTNRFTTSLKISEWIASYFIFKTDLLSRRI